MNAIELLLAQQSAPTRDGMRPPDGVSAWRQVFEREQMAALARFRSVTAPVSTSASSCASAAPGVTGGGNANAVLADSAATSSPRGTAASLVSMSRQVPQAMGPPGSPSSPPHFPQQALAGYTLRVAAVGLPGELTERVSAAPLATLLEKWPWRKLHCMAAADGLHLWLRDASATPQDPSLRRWLSALQRTLAAAGTPLASFTLNGKACLVPSVVS